MASPLLPIAMIIASIVPQLFQRRGDKAPTETATQVTETQPPGPQSPLGSALQVPMLQMLFKNLQGYQGAGMPAGAGNILGGTGMEDLMALLLKQWPELMREFAGEVSPIERVTSGLNRNASSDSRSSIRRLTSGLGG